MVTTPTDQDAEHSAFFQSFCIAIAQTTVPRRERRGVFYVREGDQARPARASPPPECQWPPRLAP